jgi:hypothetical protein
VNKTRPPADRVDDLRAMLAAYRQMTIEEMEDGAWGDLQIEIEGDLWRLEQELSDARRRSKAA